MQGGTNSPAGSQPAVHATDGAGDPEADPGAESEAGTGSLAPVRQPGDAATIVGSHLSLPSPVFPDGPSRPLPNIGTTARVGETCPVLAGRPIPGINPPSPEVLKESCPLGQSSRGRTATHLELPKANYPPDEKKRRSNSHPRGEAEPKRGCSSGAEPSWSLYHIGGQHSDKAPPQSAREQEAPESTPKLKLVVKKVRVDKAKPANFEGLGSSR